MDDLQKDQKLVELERRIERLEQQLGFRHQSKMETPMTHRQTIKSRSVSFDWDRFGRVWLPRIFIVVLLIGVVFGFLAAVNAGLLNRQTRIVIGYVTFAGLLVLGEVQVRANRHVLGQVLLGGALSVSLITTFVANSLYGFFPAWLAFPLGVVSMGIAIGLAYYHRTQSLSVLAAVAGFLLPFVVSSHSHSLVFFVSYELLISLGFFGYALWQQQTVLRYVALAQLQVAYLLYAISNGNRPLLAEALLAQHIAYVASRFLRKFKAAHYIPLAASLGLTVLWVFASLETQSITVSLCLLSGVYLVAIWKERIYFSLGLASIVAILLIHLFSPETYYPLLFIEFAIGMIVSLVYRQRWSLLGNGILFAMASVSFLLFTGRTLLFQPFDKVMSMQNGAFVICLLAVVAVYFVATWWTATKADDMLKETRVWRQIALWVFNGLLLVYVTDLDLTVFRQQTLNVKMLTMSLIWMAYAVFMLAVGILKDIKNLRIVGMVFLFVTLGKIILFDFPSVTMVVRAVLFLMLGGLGVMASRFFYRRQ